MTRPKRAAAVRAASNFSSEDKENQSPTDTPDGTPVRCLRRASFRSSRHGVRDLKRRRADFERIAKFHSVNLRNSARIPATDFSLTDDSVELSQDGVELTADWAHSIAEEAVEPLRAALRALLLRLQATPNLTEAAEQSDNPEMTGRLPSKDESVPRLAEALVTERFISHEGDHVKLLVACCLAEVLRICAPDPPIPERKLNGVCALFIEQLAVLSSPNDVVEAFRFSLLEQLATVKTFVIFCDDEDVVCDIFACFYATVQGHQSEKVKQYLADILISLLDEAEKLETNVLDALLAPLVLTYRYTEHAVALAKRVLHGASSLIQVPLSSLLNASLRGLRRELSSGTPRKSGKGRRKSPAKKKLNDDFQASDRSDLSEHHEHVSDLIAAINDIAPDVLVYVIPNLEDSFCSKDEAVRFASVSLLGRLFLSRADVGNSYPSLFAEFIKRGRDECAEIRAEVTTTLGPLMKLHPRQSESIGDMLQSRLFDREESVRLVAVQSVGKAGDLADEKLLKGHVTRLWDKKQAIRRATAKAISELYCSKPGSVLSNSANGTSAVADATNVEIDEAGGTYQEFGTQTKLGAEQPEPDYLAARTLRLSWLPGRLMEAMDAVERVGDFKTARTIEDIILWDIPGIERDEPARLKAGLRRLGVFLSHLSEPALLQLTGRIRERWKARDTLLEIARSRRRSPTSPTLQDPKAGQSRKPLRTFSKGSRGPGEERNQHYDSSHSKDVGLLVKNLTSCLVKRGCTIEDAQTFCTAIAAAPNLKLFVAIEKALDSCASYKDFKTGCEAASKSLAVSSSGPDCLEKAVLPSCYLGIFTSSFFSLATEVAIEETKNLLNEQNRTSRELRNRMLSGILRLLHMFGTDASEVLLFRVKDIRSLCEIELNGQSLSAEVMLCGLKLVTCVPPDKCPELGDSSMKAALRAFMFCKKFPCLERGAVVAKHAARAVIHLERQGTDQTGGLIALVRDLTLELDSFSGDPETIIAPVTALSQVAKHAPLAFKNAALECFDFTRALLSGSLNSRINESSRGDALGRPGGRSARDEFALMSPMFGVQTKPLSDEISDDKLLCMAELVQRAVKLFVYSLQYIDEEELASAVEVLLRLSCAKRGSIFGAFGASSMDLEDDEANIEDAGGCPLESMFAVCRLVAGRGLLYLARHPKFFREISPVVLSSTVLLVQDEKPSVRISFATTIYNGVMKKRLPLRWIVALALMAVDPEKENVKAVRRLLTSVFRHRRRLFEQARREGRKSSLLLLPEATVPELIWVLSSLPEVELDQAQGFPECEKCLQLFLDGLLESNEHTGILHEFIESLSIAEDVTENQEKGPGPRTRRIAELSGIAAMILKKKQAGKKWNLAEYPGQVSLPKDMFRIVSRKAETSGVPPVSLLELARKYDQEKGIESPLRKPAELVSDMQVSNVKKVTSRRGTGNSQETSESPQQRSTLSAPASGAQIRSPKVHSVNKRERLSRGKKRSSEELEVTKGESPSVSGTAKTETTHQHAHEAATTHENADGKPVTEAKQAHGSSGPGKPGPRKKSKQSMKTNSASTTNSSVPQIRRSARIRGI